MKQLLKFNGVNGSMGLKKGKVYNCKVYDCYNNDTIYIHIDGTGVNIPYTLTGFIQNWKLPYGD